MCVAADASELFCMAYLPNIERILYHSNKNQVGGFYSFPRENALSRTSVDFHQLKLASLRVYKI